ncbi:MAG: hypothetical protein ABIG89_02080 [Candidatus Woesearchaeota archaeon]
MVMMMDMLKQKKANFFDLQERWVEITSIFLLIVGFIVALWSRSAVVTYMVILLSGVISGRGLMSRKYSHKFYYFMIIIAYLIGFVLGSFYGKTKYILVLFILGAYIGYVLHSRDWI